jgi:hypothetical protein
MCMTIPEEGETMMVSRRDWLLLSAGMLVAGVPAHALLPSAPKPRLTVWKSPSCGCCKEWVKHMEQAGFEVVTKDQEDVQPIKRQYGVSSKLASCHTGVVNGYVIEGHVPGDLVQKVLKERPRIVGLAVPGMPAGSPGMEVGGRKDPFEVVAWDAKGNTTVYAKR